MWINVKLATAYRLESYGNNLNLAYKQIANAHFVCTEGRYLNQFRFGMSKKIENPENEDKTSLG